MNVITIWASFIVRKNVKMFVNLLENLLYLRIIAGKIDKSDTRWILAFRGIFAIWCGANDSHVEWLFLLTHRTSFISICHKMFDNSEHQRRKEARKEKLLSPSLFPPEVVKKTRLLRQSSHILRTNSWRFILKLYIYIAQTNLAIKIVGSSC